MKDYMAPMEGITNYIYRRAYHRFYHPMDKYFTPFITAKPDKRLSDKEIREVSPETNQGLTVIPQILSNHAPDFLQTAAMLSEEYGHQEINLNLGCPSGTVTAKGKGAGFLAEPDKLDAFLDEIFTKSSLKISIKTRIGTHYEEDWEYLLKIYEKYPISELSIHPRLQKDMYRGVPRLESYEEARKILNMPICYNGNIFTPKDYRMIAEKFPDTQIFMYGRGLIRNPGLVSAVRTGVQPGKAVLREFHDQVYMDYQEILSGERNVLFRMKELWSYMGDSFTDGGKYLKKIRKSQHLRDYETAVNALFTEQDLSDLSH